MKNSEIHNGLEKKEIRDFLATTYVDILKRECETKSDISSLPKDNNDPYVCAIAHAELKLSEAKESLMFLKQRHGVSMLVKMNGWISCPVAGYVEKEGGLWMDFIGTEKEYVAFIKKCNESK